MIEELKVLLEMLAKVPNAALWAVGAVFLYKLTIYLATTGSVVMLAKLAIERLHSYKTEKLTPKPVPPTPPQEHVWKVEGLCITHTGDVVPRLKSLMEALARDGDSDYLHQYHIDWLNDAVHHWHAKAGPPKAGYRYTPSKDVEP